MPASRHHFIQAANPIVYGVKFGCAGLLAIFVSLVLRLPEPTWALFTVFVLMIAKHIGAIAEKSVLRIVGTVCGGLIGYLLTGALQQNPVVYLTCLFAVVAFCTAMFGQSRYPYAFFLCGMTMTVVCSNGMNNPDFSWQYALWRIEEVVVGVIAVLLVQSVFLPRYARVEFLREVRLAVADLQEAMPGCTGRLFAPADSAAADKLGAFPKRLTAFRNLLYAGTRESVWFRRRRGQYAALIRSLAGIAHALGTLQATLPAKSRYRAAARKSLETVAQALTLAIGEAATPSSDGSLPAATERQLEDSFRALESTLLEMRHDPAARDIPIAEVMAVGRQVLALEQIRVMVADLARHFAAASQPNDGPLPPQTEPTTPDIPVKYWIHAGLKSGFVVVLAMVLTNWLAPPGGALFILSAWVFTALNPASPSGRGDCNAYQNLLWGGTTLLGLCMVLLATSPMLSSYAAFNVILFAWLFLWGFLSDKTAGVTVPMQFSMMCVVGILGLNGQQPVSFQAIVDMFFGITLGLLLAAVVGRTILPTLPQFDLRDRILELAALGRKALLTEGPGLALWERTRLALLPAECNLRLALLARYGWRPAHLNALRDCVEHLARAAREFAIDNSQAGGLFPPSCAEAGNQTLALIREECARTLEQTAQFLADRSPDRPGAGELADRMQKLEHMVGSARLRMIAENASFVEVCRLLGFAGRALDASADVQRGAEAAGSASPHTVFTDWRL